MLEFFKGTQDVLEEDEGAIAKLGMNGKGSWIKVG